MFWNRRLLYKGRSNKEYNEIRNILEINNIKYSDKVENENKDIGPMIDKTIIGTFGKTESFSYEYSIFVNKEDYEVAENLINNIK